MAILGVILLGITPIIFMFVYLRESKKEKPQYLSMIFISFLVVGLFLIFNERVTELSNPYLGTLKMSAAKALSYEEDIKTIKERVENQSATIDLIAKRSLDEIQPEILRVAEEVKKFERFINDMKDNLQKEYKTVLDELARITLLNSLPILADRAISEGDRGALNELNRIAQSETEINPIKRAALEEIRRVISNLSNPPFMEPSLTVTLEDGTVKKDWEISTARLMMSLSDPDWKVRAKAAMLLGFRREKGVPDILLQTARTDTHLIVVYHASVSFKYATRTGPRLAGEPSITQSEALDMLDTDKLEQYWREKAAEINERLPEIKK